MCIIKGIFNLSLIWEPFYKGCLLETRWWDWGGVSDFTSVAPERMKLGQQWWEHVSCHTQSSCWIPLTLQTTTILIKWPTSWNSFCLGVSICLNCIHFIPWDYFGHSHFSLFSPFGPFYEILRKWPYSYRLNDNHQKLDDLSSNCSHSLK